MRKALVRSITVILILAAALGVGFIYEAVWDRLDRSRYPRPEEYREYIEKYSAEYGVPEYIIYSVIKTESNFVSSAKSEAGAVGLMQITEDTFNWLSMKLRDSQKFDVMYSPEENIRYGTYYLCWLSGEFGRWDNAYAAYNAGPAKVKSWLENPEYSDGSGALTAIPYKETREYVERVDRACEIYLKLYYNNEVK